MSKLKQLTSADTLLVTKEELTRGVDYRAAKGTPGIALLVMSASPNQRAYLQLLGRVGRYREPCKRFIWDQLAAPVDLDQQIALLAKLRKQRKPIAQKRTSKRNQKPVAGQSKLAFGKTQK